MAFSQALEFKNSSNFSLFKLIGGGKIELLPSNPPLLPNNKLYFQNGPPFSGEPPRLFWNGSVISSPTAEHALDADDGNPTDAVYVDNNGNVGVGTTNPSATLHLKDASNSLLRLESTASSGAYPFISFYQPTAYAAFIQAKNTDFSLLNIQAGKFTLGTNNADRLTISSAGNVGIGISIPHNRLQIHSGTANTYLNIQNQTSGTGSNDGLEIALTGINALLKNQEDGDLILATDSGYDMVIEDGGEIGIGISNPEHILHVSGSNTGAVGHFRNTVTNQDGYGVYGSCDNTKSDGFGGSFSGGKYGMAGFVTPNSSANLSSTRYYGLLGEVSNHPGGEVSYGVTGTSTNGELNIGVYGYASGDGAATTNYGVYTYLGIGYFIGDVHVNGYVGKAIGTFKIDHPLDPENKYLQHSFVESPDMMNLYNGNITLDEYGKATVVLPDWFEPLNKNFRYQLSPIGTPGPNLFIAEKISSNSFKIAGGEAGMKVSWQVTGVRQDVYANNNRLQVVVDKSIQERGKYLYPAGVGLSYRESVHYDKDEEKKFNIEKNKEQ